jgi:DeoR/GlpR family transcriptional regulator of sugar metabolism
MDWLARLRPDLAFLGATAVHPKDGLFTTETSEAAVKAEAIRRSRTSYLLADSSKVNALASVHFAGWVGLTGWFTDTQLPKASHWPVRIHRVTP